MKKTALTGLLLFFFAFAGAQGVWTQKASLPDTARIDAMAFAGGGKGYITQGGDITMDRLHSVWQYDPVSNTWAQKQDFSGTARWQGVSFSIGQKGYIGMGFDVTGWFTNDLWEYDPANDAWTQKASLPGDARCYPAGFAIGAKGYVGMGTTILNGIVDDFWEYDPAQNSWTQKANFPCPTGRFLCAGFAVGSKGYAGLGRDQNTYYNDFWEYDPATDTWTQRSNFPPGPREEFDGAQFAIGNYGYLGTGRYPASSSTFTYYNDFWRYDPANDSWTQIPSLPASTRIGASSVVINNIAYVGLGFNGVSTAFNDWWSYNPDVTTDVEDVLHGNAVSIFPNPFSEETTLSSETDLRNATLTITDISGRFVKKIENISGHTVRIQRDGLPAGVYLVQLSQNGKTTPAIKIMIAG
jgi:N-acetylneuraminic acid mutarotase